MATDHDHVEAIRQRLMAKKREKEAEIEEIEQMIRVLGEAPKVLGGALTTRPSPAVGAPPERTYNKNIAEFVRTYVEEVPEENPPHVLSVKDIVKYLRSKGIKGKERSLYSYTYAILKEEAKQGNLEFEKGVGYTKAVKRNS